MDDKTERAKFHINTGIARHNVSPQRQIALGVLEDVLDRRGIKHEFEQVDSDVIQEILSAWEEITRVIIQGRTIRMISGEIIKSLGFKDAAGWISVLEEMSGEELTIVRCLEK